MGNALFADRVKSPQHDHKPCGMAAAPVDPEPVVADHLSPVFARFLLVEPIDRLMPGHWLVDDRAQVLANSFLSDSIDKEFMQTAIGDSFDLKGARPALISVAMDVANGRRFVMAPFQPPEEASTALWWPFDADPVTAKTSYPEISVLDAAGLSARFPWITPTGRLRVKIDKELVLADGGYFDDSGADTVLDLINALRISKDWHNFAKAGVQSTTPDDISEENCEEPAIQIVDNFHDQATWKPCVYPVFFIHLALAANEENPSQPTSASSVSQSFIFDPIRALLATRESRAEIALQRSDFDRCGTHMSGAECYSDPNGSFGFFRNDISPVKLSLPLGWYMSQSSFKSILDNSIPDALFDYHKTRREADNDLELLIFHFDPDLYKQGADPSIDDLFPSP
ncbi:hypothetical protein [Mesorhizobium sp. M0276]|uniref:hypothetical protein n=1 Tax=Mesorhizobium sp. M0276 TaxID=2956928 RepID=UPI00333AA0E7